jgi:hypothetical protein
MKLNVLLTIAAEFLEDIINDSGLHLLFKSTVFIIASGFFVGDWLHLNGLDPNYFYFGMAGQFLIWLRDGRSYLKNKSNNLLISWRTIVLLLIDLLMGGSVAMISVSYLSLTGFTPVLLAVLIGALSYKVWDLMLKKLDNNIKDDNIDTFADGGNNPTDPPR